METKEELLKEHAKWIVNYVEADKRLKDLLPPVSNLSRGEKLQYFIVTKESLDEFASAEKDVKNALTKLREIREKLSELR